MRSHRHRWFALLFVSLLLGACALDRTEIDIPKAVFPVPASGAKKPLVFIRSVVDDRIFAEAPADPKIPSLGFGGASKAAPSIKARAIARKRNGLGDMKGDVLLVPGRTVADLVRENATAAFAEAGFEVVNSAPSPSAKALVADIHIREFWGWESSNFNSGDLHTQITTAFDFDSAPGVVVQSQSVINLGLTTQPWIRGFGEGLRKYRTEAATKLSPYRK